MTTGLCVPPIAKKIAWLAWIVVATLFAATVAGVRWGVGQRPARREVAGATLVAAGAALMAW